MILRQFLHTQPVVAASYIVGCGGCAECAVVDPVLPATDYIAAARDLGMGITFVVDTHVHADHVSTARELADRTGAAYLLHESARAAFAHRAVTDRERFQAGNVEFEVLHLPGHTPEHIGLLVRDRSRTDEPWVVLTGHALMVGDMGRTELATDAESGARALFRSAERLRALPDWLPVMPGAFSGSVCGRGLSGNPTSTIGFERRFNRAFATLDEEAFVTAMLRDTPRAPPGAAAVRAQNLGQDAA